MSGGGILYELRVLHRNARGRPGPDRDTVGWELVGDGRSPSPTNSQTPSPEFGTTLGDVTCATAGLCIATGGYVNISGDSEGLIDTLAATGISPTISSANQTTFKVGQAASFTLTATGTPAPSITKTGVLPEGLRFKRGKGTATISGTPAPTTAGTYPITITASNGVLPKASQTLTLTVKK